MVGAIRRVARYRAAQRAAPTFRNDDVEAQSRSERDRWTFYETIKHVCINEALSAYLALRLQASGRTYSPPTGVFGSVCARASGTLMR